MGWGGGGGGEAFVDVVCGKSVLGGPSSLN